ncbi:MAG: hypothetical protein K6G58_06155 [Lachnospiraceae bacterium]|nr:hypothetical protein [Lachnospiraceae bacterium]
MAVAKDFPLEKLLSGWGLNGAKDILIWPGYAKKLSKLCSRGNLEYMKDFLIVSYCLESSFYLDRESLEKLKEFTNSRLKEPIDTGETPEQEEMELMFDKYIGSTPMCGAMNRLYCEYFFDDECVGDLNSIVAEMFDSFEDMFNGEEWMSDEGKAACIEKLRAIRVHIAYQDFESVDYSKLDIKSREEGGNFLEAYFDSKRFAALHIAERLGAPYDINYWDPIAPGLSTTVTNAAYNPSTNGIYIFAGVCEAPMYSLDMSYEEKLAGLGAVVGHEITHGFDNKGVLYDKDGIKNSDWMPAADQGMFVDRSEKVGQHVSTIKPFPGSGLYDGRKVTAELTADMGGMKVTLMMAKKHPGFDYDRYFMARASDWRTNVPIEVESSRLSQDPHPLNFLRINIPHQQFEEFYSTYNITENDRMYIEPGKRIAVW